MSKIEDKLLKTLLYVYDFDAPFPFTTMHFLILHISKVQFKMGHNLLNHIFLFKCDPLIIIIKNK